MGQKTKEGVVLAGPVLMAQMTEAEVQKFGEVGVVLAQRMMEERVLEKLGLMVFDYLEVEVVSCQLVGADLS